MHIPDGYLAAPVWGGLAAAAAAGVSIAARRARTALDEARVPLMGVLGAFIFAAQMINFPVAAGASGHLVGAAVLAIALGPAPAVVVMTAILAIQALVFQDGGVLALGANVFNMALAGVFAGAWPYQLFQHTRARWLGALLGGALSVAVAASLALGEIALSGIPLPSHLLGFAVLVFCLNAALEGGITAAVVSSLEKINPQLLETRAPARQPVLIALLLAALVLAAGGFLVASALPDGLARLAALAGLEERQRTVFPAPLPGYEALALARPWFRKAVAGLSGLAAVLIVCWLAGKWISRWRSK